MSIHRGMAGAPHCARHPGGRVRRNGYYGRRKQFVRWQCVPDDGSRPHMVRPELSSKLVGGREGCCPECEREWGETEGMPTGTGDRYTLREKAATLVLLAQGMSFRAASEAARRQSGHLRRRRARFAVASRDGRLARDWVSQYTPILADHYLPKRWPRTLVLDKLPVHVRDWSSNTPRPSGRGSFFVLAALSYVGDNAVLWRISVSDTADHTGWERLFAQLPGEPTFITCDRDSAMLNAIAATWPNAKVYPCAHHLLTNVEAILKEGKLYDRRRLLVRTLHRRTFIDPVAYLAFRQAAGRYLRSDLTKASGKQLKAMVRLNRWVQDNEEAIARSMYEKHWPVTTGAIERPLRVMKNAIYDRRANLKNLARIEHLLTLAQLYQMGCADERKWAAILRKNHLAHGGVPPPRRLVDDPALYTHRQPVRGRVSAPSL